MTHPQFFTAKNGGFGTSDETQKHNEFIEYFYEFDCSGGRSNRNAVLGKGINLEL
ncbi:hypothetical protein NKJ10_29900 [Mesorhizobium sp. M0204]|uniref:hypothetical protein n=1 Tax=Mesorhizobium sp. M0204 TaxID=2956913 RepID=UPI0033386BF4